MLIKTKIYPSGGITCQEMNCKFKSKCANHETAGDYRSEDGFTPELKILEIIKNTCKISCNTKNKKSLKEDSCGIFPENFDELGFGAMTIQDGKLHFCFDSLDRKNPYGNVIEELKSLSKKYEKGEWIRKSDVEKIIEKYG